MYQRMYALTNLKKEMPEPSVKNKCCVSWNLLTSWG